MEDFETIKLWPQTAIATWRTGGVKLNPGATVLAILEVEQMLGFGFPEDFKNLYLEVNGFEDYAWNDHMFSLWSLERMLKEYEEENDSNFIGFCDFLINSHTIGFLRNDAGIFKSYDLRPIAKTFEEAIELINSGADCIY